MAEKTNPTPAEASDLPEVKIPMTKALLRRTLPGGWRVPGSGYDVDWPNVRRLLNEKGASENHNVVEVILPKAMVEAVVADPYDAARVIKSRVRPVAIRDISGIGDPGHDEDGRRIQYRRREMRPVIVAKREAIAHNRVAIEMAMAAATFQTSFISDDNWKGLGG